MNKTPSVERWIIAIDLAYLLSSILLLAFISWDNSFWTETATHGSARMIILCAAFGMGMWVAGMVGRASKK